MKATFKKYFGKVIIISTILIIGIYSNINMFKEMSDSGEWKYGTVVSKDIGMTDGKYPKQYWVISFKYDDNVLGTRDIEVTYSTYAKLNAGDRTSFKVTKREYNRSLSNWNEILFITSIFIAFVIDFFIFVFFIYFLLAILSKLWKGDY